MSGTAHFKEPIACTEGERREFARLVRQGFDAAAEGLDGRIRDAKWLAFYYAAGDTLAAVVADLCGARLCRLFEVLLHHAD